MDRDLIDQIASVAHELWRRNLEREGWRPGPRFDADKRIHDAMVPYRELSPFDQRQVRVGVECCELDEELLRSVDHVRGPSREFRVEEMREGLPVQLTAPFGDDPVEAQGTIEKWEPGPEGSVETIHVRFPDGDLVGYCPSQRELRRIE